MVFCHEWAQVEDGEMCAIRLNDELHEARGEPILLFRASKADWSKPFGKQDPPANRVTGGPFLHRLPNGKLLMLWSTLGCEGYAMGYAVSDTGSITGPWRQLAEPIYSHDGGHGMLFRDFDGHLRMTLHSPNRTPDERPLWIEVVEQEDGLAVSSPPPTPRRG